MRLARHLVREDTPLERILECRPDLLVKGGDWAIDKSSAARGAGLGRHGALDPLPARALDHGHTRQNP